MIEIGQHIGHDLPVLLSLAVFESSHGLPWIEFLAIGLLYTGVVFRDERNRNGPHILSKENSRPLSVIAGAHLGFLSFFFVLAEFTISDGSAFPTWLVSPENRDEAAILCLFILAEVLSLIERGWLYRARFPDDVRAQGSSRGGESF